MQDKLQNAQQIQASGAAFAVILDFHDGSVVTWGQGEACGHGTLKNVQQIHASVVSFAATLGSGSVLTWGDSTKVQAKALAGKDWLFMDYGRAGLDSEGACLVMAVQVLPRQQKHPPNRVSDTGSRHSKSREKPRICDIVSLPLRPSETNAV